MDPALSSTKSDATEGITFGKITSLNGSEEKCYMYWGWLFSFLTGLGLPAAFIIFGDSMEALGHPEKSPEDNLADMVSICSYMFIIGAVLWLFAFLYQTLLAIFAEKTSRKIKVAYLRAVFRQDASWFDNTNYTELASNLSKQSHSIQKGVGEKIGVLIMGIG
jgi:ATP-binding cassette subfamily B (MDR/TAP) protein 1